MLNCSPGTPDPCEIATSSSWSGRAGRLVLLGCFAALAVGIGCGGRDPAEPDLGRQDSAATGGSPAPGGEGGTGGQDSGSGGMGGKAASDDGGSGGVISKIPSAAGCVYDGRNGPGGSDAIYCHTATVSFSPPLAPGHTFEVSTDLSRVPVTTPYCIGLPCAWKSPEEQTTTALWMDLRPRGDDPIERYPTAITVRVSGADGVFEHTFSDLHYSCVARTFDDWCWEAAPVTFEPPAATKP
jgi:hypothetical protein